jgi:hypothetical protein
MFASLDCIFLQRINDIKDFVFVTCTQDTIVTVDVEINLLCFFIFFIFYIYLG